MRKRSGKEGGREGGRRRERGKADTCLCSEKVLYKNIPTY